MDVARLLSMFCPVREDDLQRKLEAISSALEAVSQLDPSADEEAFLQRIPRAILALNFGGSATDSYFTRLFAIISWFEVIEYDVSLVAILNYIVLELNFQTRWLARLSRPEVFVLDGDQNTFRAAMANASGVAGVNLRISPGSLPKWASHVSQTILLPEHHHYFDLSEVPNLFQIIERQEIGCLCIVRPSENAPVSSFAERYAQLSPFVTPNTIYVISDRQDVIVKLAGQLQARYPKAEIWPKLQHQDYGILVFTGIPHLPDVGVEEGIEECTLYEMNSKTIAQNGNIRMLEPFSTDIISVHTTPKPPFNVISSVPLGEEIRQRISNPVRLWQSSNCKAISLTNGMLCPITGPALNTYLILTSDREIIYGDGFGDTVEAMRRTEAFLKSSQHDDGMWHTKVRSGSVVHVTGRAMPLAFTPNLHNWFSHFMIQCLPRITLAKELGSDIRIIVPDTLRRKQRDMLAHLGYDDSKLVQVNESASICADELIIPSTWNLMFNEYNTRVYNELVEKWPTRQKGTRRLFISRESRTEWRNLVTYKAIEAKLVRDFGFEIVRPELLSLEEEVRLFGSAEVIVGSEGAGMYGAVYAQSSASILVIADEDYVMPILASLASVRGFEIGYVFGESMRARRDMIRRLSFGHAEYAVDPMEVAQLVQSALKLRAAN